MTPRFVSVNWLATASALWVCLAQAEPVKPAEFQALAQQRDAALGSLVYSDASMSVRSKGVNIEQKTCSTTPVTVDEEDPSDIARFTAEMAAYQAAAPRMAQDQQREAATIQAQFEDDMKAIRALPPAERTSKFQEAYARYQKRLMEAASRYSAQAPKPVSREKHEFRLLELTVLIKDLPAQSPIIQTDPPFTVGLPLEKHFATRWKAAPGALDAYVGKVIPAVVKACPNVSAVRLSLGFQEVVQVSNQPPGHYEVAKVVMAKQANGAWANQHIQGYGTFEVSVLGVARRQLTSSAMHGQLVWLDQQELNALAKDDLLLQVEALAITVRDEECALDGCPAKCGPDDESCPGGKQAAMVRSNLSWCSGKGKWTGKNCKIIESEFGQLDQSASIDVPAEYEVLYRTLQAGKAFSPNNVNVAFTSGLGTYLIDKCRILGSKETAVIRQFSQSGFLANLLPSQRSLERHASAMAAALAAIKAGNALGARIACRSPDSYMLAKRIVRSIEASPQSGGR